MAQRNYQEITEKLIKQAKAQNANVRIAIRNDKSFNVSIRNNEVEELQEAGSTSLSLSVNLDNKTASAATSDMSESTLETLLNNAIERAKFSSVDESAIFPEYEKLTVDPESLKMFSPEIREISPEEKIATARKLEEICLKDKRITVSAGSGYNTNENELFLALSNGFFGNYKSSSCSVGIHLQAGEGENATQDGWWDSARSPRNLLPTEEIAQTAIERATRMQGAKKIPTQTAPVIVDRNIASAVFGFLLQSINGRNIYMQQSIFAGKLNEEIANKNITLFDDPLIPASPGARPFDSEGIPSRKNMLIENGVLKNYLLNTYSANKLGLKVNGMASGTSNLFMQPGSYSEADLIKSVDRGLLLLRTIGQGTDATTGGYSRGAYGIWIENGELTHPVSEITISSNLREMMMGIEMIANNPNTRRAMQIPTFKIASMTISGE